MCYAAEIFVIFYSQWDCQMVNISRILEFLARHGFDEFGWNDPNVKNFCQKFFSAFLSCHYGFNNSFDISNFPFPTC